MARKVSLKLNQIIAGDAFQVASGLPTECVDTIVTSPPYYLQRDYGSDAQIGQEASASTYVERLTELFGELLRVVKPTGSVWLIIGDKYQDGELMGMPWRVALGLKDVGWRLRSDCIWHKPNAMPSSVKNRPTTDHEYIFFFSKSRDYFYDADAIREPHVTFSEKSKMKGGRRHFGKRGGTPEQGKNGGNTNLHDARWDQAFHPKGRNKRTVWSIPAFQISRSPFRRLPRNTGRNLHPSLLPYGRSRFGSIFWRRDNIGGRAKVGTQLSGDRLRQGVL